MHLACGFFVQNRVSFRSADRQANIFKQKDVKYAIFSTMYFFRFY